MKGKIMSNLQRHKDCTMRSGIGNCLAIGGFCTSVSKENCEGLQNAYANGKRSVEISKDAISRKWVLNEITTKVEDDDSLTNEQKDSLSAAKYLVRHAPPVVPQPKEGKWIIHKINGIPHTVECSHCHQHYDYEELRRLGRSKGCIDIPHCPNCGAKMKGATK